ncbi:MAG: polyprenyl synthetase family protein [Vampirovibrionia bacterium]
MNLKSNNYIKQLQDAVNSKLDEFIPQIYPDTLFEAMRYSVLGSGKRLRAIFCVETCKAFGKPVELALPMACAIEIIHAQSLIHDDLPCMDNDDFRRGKPSTHKQFGEAMAVLAGDALIPYAYDVFLKHTPDSVSSDTKLKIVKEFSETIGPKGLVAGQVIDVETEGKLIDKETLKYIHDNKSGALYRFAIRSGAILAECSERELALITEFAEAIGLAFQISDDILDITATKDTLGKTPGKDQASGKNTYPLIYGFDNAVNELNRLCDLSINILKDNDIKSDVLSEIAQYIADRIK